MEHTKAQMLLYLKENMAKVNILPLLIVESNEFYFNTEQVIEKIINFSQN